MNAQLEQAAPGPRYYVGGGNVAGILGLSPYRSPLDEYLTIVSENDPISARQDRFFRRRKALEPFAAEVFEQVTGLKVIDRNKRYDDPKLPFLRAEIDFELSDGGNGETKTVHPLAAKDWGDPDSGAEPPLYVTAQVMHGLSVTGKSHAWVHALIGLDDDRIYRVHRDDDLITAIRQREYQFWQFHILPRVMPPPATEEDLARLYRRDSGRTVEADAEIAAKFHELIDCRARQKLIESEREGLELAIKLFMRDATTLLVHGKPVLTWKTQESRRLDTTAFKDAHRDLYEAFATISTTRVFRVK